MRERISPNKLPVSRWVEIIEAGHRAGVPSTSTVMFGHIETPAELSEHMRVVRELQNKTGGFTEFVPLSFIPFQTLLGLPVDGIVGQQTWNYLVNGYLAAPDPQTAATDVFSAWEANNPGQAGKNATPAAVNEIFARSFSSGDGWAFEGCQGALGHTFCSWKRSNGHELRIGVINAVEGPYYVADQATFT